MNESVCRPRAKKKTARAAEEAAVVAVEVLPAETLMNQTAWVAEGAEVVAVAEVIMLEVVMVVEMIVAVEVIVAVAVAATVAVTAQRWWWRWLSVSMPIRLPPCMHARSSPPPTAPPLPSAPCPPSRPPPSSLSPSPSSLSSSSSVSPPSSSPPSPPPLSPSPSYPHSTSVSSTVPFTFLLAAVRSSFFRLAYGGYRIHLRLLLAALPFVFYAFPARGSL